MSIFGCLPILLVVILLLGLSFIGKSLEMIGATVVWLWDSFCNLFRSADNQKEVYNPWTGRSNQYRESSQSQWRGTSRTEHEESPESSPNRPKFYDKDDGDYIDYTEIKD